MLSTFLQEKEKSWKKVFQYITFIKIQAFHFSYYNLCSAIFYIFAGFYRFNSDVYLFGIIKETLFFVGVNCVLNNSWPDIMGRENWMQGNAKNILKKKPKSHKCIFTQSHHCFVAIVVNIIESNSSNSFMKLHFRKVSLVFYRSIDG